MACYPFCVPYRAVTSAATDVAGSVNSADAPGREEQAADGIGNDQGISVLSWHTESKIRTWIMEQQLETKDKITGSAEESFTIGLLKGILQSKQSIIIIILLSDEGEEDEIVLPTVIQESLQLAFDADREVLQRRIEELEAEKQQSQQAFDTYRDRARSSLLKSANDLKLAEENVAKMAAQLKVTVII